MMWLHMNLNININNLKLMAESKETLIDMPENSDMKAEAMKEAKWAVDNIKVEYKMSKHIK